MYKNQQVYNDENLINSLTGTNEQNNDNIQDKQIPSVSPEYIEEKEEELTPEMIAEFKKLYKKVYKTTLIDGTVIVWRRYNRQEYKEIMKKYEQEKDADKRVWSREEECCRRCILFPGKEKTDFILNNMAGVATLLSDKIYEKSGFLIPKQTEEL